MATRRGRGTKPEEPLIGGRGRKPAAPNAPGATSLGPKATAVPGPAQPRVVMTGVGNVAPASTQARARRGHAVLGTGTLGVPAGPTARRRK